MKDNQLSKEEKRKIKGEKWLKRSEQMAETGKGMQKGGAMMAGCGCLLTLFITIPIIIIVIFFFM